jgi:hypothetical protein
MRSQAESVPHAEIAALIADLDAAASALDIDRFLRFLAEGPDFAWTFNGHLVTTQAEVRAMHDAAWAKLARASSMSDVRLVARSGPLGPAFRAHDVLGKPGLAITRCFSSRRGPTAGECCRYESTPSRER